MQHLLRVRFVWLSDSQVG